MMLFLILFIAAIGAILFLFHIHQGVKNFSALKGKHVMITGGSSGIGRAVAVCVVQHGAHVSLLARKQSLLDEACREVQRHTQDCGIQRIQTYSIDLTQDYKTVEDVIKTATSEVGPVDILINCAGTSVSYKFEDTPVEEFQRLLNVNYIGSVHATKAVVSSMKERKSGKIVFVSSVAGLMGLFGYTAYAASKFALMGLAQSLHMELKPYGVGVTVAFPPDTDTPGFKEEEKIKPLETRIISETGGIYSAEHVANKIIKDTLRSKFSSVVGLEGFFMSTLCAGMTPITSALQLVVQVFLMGLFRLGAGVFLLNCWRIVQRCANQREEGKKNS